MKKLVVFLCISLLVLSACIPNVNVTDTPPKENPTNKGTIYFLAANNHDPFYIPGVAGFMKAAEELGWKAEFVGPMDANVGAQMETFEQLVASPETKGIFWYPADFNLGQPYIVAAQAKGIPVVIGAADSPFKDRKAFIGYDNTVLGQQAATWAAKLIDCKGSVGVISGNGAMVVQRAEAFMAHIKSVCPDVIVQERAVHDQSTTNAASVVEAYVVAHPDLSLLWFADGLSGEMAQTWKDQQSKGVKTMFLATDMPPTTLTAVKDGVFVGTVGQDTYTEAYWAAMMLDALIKGLRVPDTLFLSAIMVDKTNVDQFLEKK